MRGELERTASERVVKRYSYERERERERTPNWANMQHLILWYAGATFLFLLLKDITTFAQFYWNTFLDYNQRDITVVLLILITSLMQSIMLFSFEETRWSHTVRRNQYESAFALPTTSRSLSTQDKASNGRRWAGTTTYYLQTTRSGKVDIALLSNGESYSTCRPLCCVLISCSTLSIHK